MIKRIAVIGLTMLGVSTFAVAQDAIKPYLGVVVGSGTITQSALGISASEGTGMNLQLNGGLMFNKHIGVEAFYTSNGSYDAALGNSISANSYGANLKVAIPFTDSPFSIYGKLGFASQTLAASGENDSLSGVSYGVGAGYAFTPNLQGVIEYNATQGTENFVTNTLSMFGLGINYSFA